MKQGWVLILLAVGLLLVVAAPGCDGNGYEAGLDAFNEGDYTTALNTFRSRVLFMSAEIGILKGAVVSIPTVCKGGER